MIRYRNNTNKIQEMIDKLLNKWKKYWEQQDFNKWSTLRNWLKLSNIRRRIQVIEKDLRNDQSPRNKRLLMRIIKAETLMQMTKKELQELYAKYHLESKLSYSENKLRQRIMAAVKSPSSKEIPSRDKRRRKVRYNHIYWPKAAYKLF